MNAHEKLAFFKATKELRILARIIAIGEGFDNVDIFFEKVTGSVHRIEDVAYTVNYHEGSMRRTMLAKAVLMSAGELLDVPIPLKKRGWMGAEPIIHVDELKPWLKATLEREPQLLWEKFFRDWARRQRTKLIEAGLIEKSLKISKGFP